MSQEDKPESKVQLRKVLFLCTEPAGYFLNCIRLLHQDGDSLIKVVHWPVISNAPFTIDLPGIDVEEKSSYSISELIERCISFGPDLVYVAGWIDHTYLRIAKLLRSTGSVVIGGLDNPWKGTFRQRLSSWASFWLIKPYFDYLWVPGNKQYAFAQHLGYKSNRILRVLYVADVENFASPHERAFKKYLVYVGRFEHEKGVELLVDTFNSLNEDERNGWKLRMIGNGSLKMKLRSSDFILFEDFMQPKILAEQTSDAGGFILPSLIEPWGVVVQEFAAAGLPLILSDAVSSGEVFLSQGKNGFLFQNGNKESLRAALIQFFQLDDKELKEMGLVSSDLARKLTPRTWIDQLNSIKINR